MRRFTLLITVFFYAVVILPIGVAAADLFDLQLQPGSSAVYALPTGENIPDSVVREFTLSVGKKDSSAYRWYHLHAVKANAETLDVYLQSNGYPSQDYSTAQSTIPRYIVRSGGNAVSYQHEFSGAAVLPSNGAWRYLFPRSDVENTNGFPRTVHYLGLSYTLQSTTAIETILLPSTIQTIALLPDAFIGVPNSIRPKDDTRRYDDSEYEYSPLTIADFEEMIEAGMNCFRADKDTAKWFKNRNVFYWGVSAADLPYPEWLYQSNYVGPSLFLDEPAVVTRDYTIRPKLRESQEYRRTITPQLAFDALKTHFQNVKYEGHPTEYLAQLKHRPDVNTGAINFMQRNIYSWETMVSTAAYQLSEGGTLAPNAIVFEPPGRIGSRRTLPEFNMSYGCQIPVHSPKNFTSIINSMLRGAARLTDKEWGTSIYGSVDRTDALWFFTHAYDMGASRFMMWNSHRLACVPYQECLALAKNLRGHIENHPKRDLDALITSAEIAILFPPGYNLGHVYMGRGLLWGVPELNLERKNQHGLLYRSVMTNLFTEIERSLRLGIEFDVLWDLDDLQLSGYREIVHINEDGSVVIHTEGQKEVLKNARLPNRPQGTAPKLRVEVSLDHETFPVGVTARAVLEEGSSPVYYTMGSDPQGIYHNVKVLWELYGPNEEDHRIVMDWEHPPQVIEQTNTSVIENRFTITKPGTYRLRSAVSDIAGRTSIVWNSIVVVD